MRYWYFLLRRRQLKATAVVVQGNTTTHAFYMDNQTILHAVHIGNGQVDKRRLGIATHKGSCSVVFRVLHVSVWSFNNNHLFVEDKGKKGGNAAMSYICFKPRDPALSILPLIFNTLPPGNDKRIPQNIQDKETQHPDTNKYKKMRAVAWSQWLGVNWSGWHVGHRRRLLRLG